LSSNPLSAERIIKEALSLLAEEGLEKVTLRRLASRLNVQAMSIYWHIKNKDELYSRMSDAVFADCLESIPPCTTWQQWLTAFGLELWRAQHEVRDAARLIFAAPHSVEALERMSHAVTAPLVELGLPRTDALRVQSSVQALIVGWTGIDQSFGRHLDEVMPLERTMIDSLEALIAGWELRLSLEALSPADPSAKIGEA
jgi:TetR/AcrR family transcriptional regulator, tetracycline repressor protein